MADTKKKVADEIQEPSIPQVEKMVTIKIPIDREDKEDKVVWVNERRFLIKRGVAVDVPESVADILQKEEDMNAVIFDYEQSVQK